MRQMAQMAEVGLQRDGPDNCRGRRVGTMLECQKS